MKMTQFITLPTETVSDLTMNHTRHDERKHTLSTSWQQRPLTKIYSVIYIDAIYSKPHEFKTPVSTVYMILGLDLEGNREIVGYWLGNGMNSQPFWLRIITELKTRGVEDILIACINDIPLAEDALRTVFPNTEIHQCILPLIRKSIAYIRSLDRKEFMADLRKVYLASNRDDVKKWFTVLETKWKYQYATVIATWESKLAIITKCASYSRELQHLICSTSVLERHKRFIKKETESLTYLSGPEEIYRLLYLATRKTDCPWNTAMLNWTKILAQMPDHLMSRIQTL